MDLFFRGSHTTNPVTCGFSKSYNQAAQVPSSNVTCKSPRSPLINCRIMLAFVSTTHSITIFPAPFITAIEMLSLCTSMPIYFLLSIEGVPFCRDLRQAPKPYSKRGALLYCVGNSYLGITSGLLVIQEESSVRQYSLSARGMARRLPSGES